MSMRCLFLRSFFPRIVLDEILDLIESVSEGFPTYSCRKLFIVVGGAGVSFFPFFSFLFY